MINKIILRTTSNLSFCGEIVTNNLLNEKGALLKTSPRSDIKIWCPIDEIKTIIYPDGKKVEGEDIKHELRL
ncbi:hypothetical protein [Vallitalea guaymasensis]|uniref:hypothetical protein n=1 Tax=Vallitalea guaymasensis TaxID=1185412 RepID=UPI000DE51290|nr:hypothetical protein [Vallitalea guaymasensis]